MLNKNRIKIVYVLPISWGGIPHYTAELANAVSEYADVVVLKPKDKNDSLFSQDVQTISTFDPLYFSRKSPRTALSFKNIINIMSFRHLRDINEINPDIIHFTGHYPHTAMFIYFNSNKLSKDCKLICTMHATFSSSVVSTRNRGISIAILNSISEFTKRLVRYDQIIVHTEDNKRTLVNRNFDSEKIQIMPHGAFTFFNEYYKNSTNGSDENCILFFGYIIKNKGVEYLLEAIPIISKEIPDIKLIIAGEGDISKYSQYMVDNPYLEIYNEFIPNEKVSELFHRAKVVVLPYTYHQGHSGVLTIAFSFGKAVVVTDAGELPELAKNCGLMVPAKNSEALANAIIKLIKDGNLRNSFGKNALEKATELSWDSIAKLHMELYQKCFNNKH